MSLAAPDGVAAHAVPAPEGTGGVAARAVAAPGATLAWPDVRAALARGLAGVGGGRVLVLIPDHTRSLPLPALFRDVVEILEGAAELTFLVALGTHPPLAEERLRALVGITAEERAGRYRHVRIANHAWDDPAAMVSLGRLPLLPLIRWMERKDG